MKFSLRFATYITISTFILQIAYAAPFASNSTLVARKDFSARLEAHGSSCTYWKDQVAFGQWQYKIQCTKIGRGLKIAAVVAIDKQRILTGWTDNNSLGRIVKTVPITLPPTFDEDGYFGYVFDVADTTDSADRGNCICDLVEVEHFIKNGWYSSMTCTDISPYLKVRAVLDIPGAFDQYTDWIETPQTIQTLEREAWFGGASAYEEWRVRSPY